MQRGIVRESVGSGSCALLSNARRLPLSRRLGARRLRRQLDLLSLPADRVLGLVAYRRTCAALGLRAHERWRRRLAGRACVIVVVIFQLIDLFILLQLVNLFLVFLAVYLQPRRYLRLGLRLGLGGRQVSVSGQRLPGRTIGGSRTRARLGGLRRDRISSRLGIRDDLMLLLFLVLSLLSRALVDFLIVLVVLVLGRSCAPAT